MNAQNPVRTLSAAECWQLLSTVPVGRLITRVGESVEVAPVNFVVSGESVYFRTGAGNKLAELTSNPEVVFEADCYDGESGWSVVCHGHANVLEGEELAAAEELPLRPFVPTFKAEFVRVRVARVTGREFVFALPGEE